MGDRWLRTVGLAERSFPLADCLLAAVLFAAFELADGNSRYNPIHRPTAPHILRDVVGAVMMLSVALRRRHPLGV